MLFQPKGDFRVLLQKECTLKVFIQEDKACKTKTSWLFKKKEEFGATDDKDLI